MVESALEVESQGFNWRALLRVCALAGVIALLATAVLLDDLLAAVLAVIVLLGLLLLRFRGGWVGVAVLGLVFADILVWTLSGAVSNIVRGERFVAVVIPAALAAISLAAIIAAGGMIIRRCARSGGESWAARTGLGAVILFVLLVAASFFVRKEGQTEAQPLDITLVAENMAFSSQELQALPGEITVHLDNHDLWWHTFTIDELGIDLQVPMGANQQVTFEAPPGTYRFYCGIPGHEAIGMEGMLIVGEGGEGQ